MIWAALWGIAGSAEAVTHTVDTTADVIDGADGVTSLREALLDAGMGDTIDFDGTVFPTGAGTTILVAGSPLPPITVGMVTVVGAAGDTVRIDGSLLPAGTGTPPSGLTLASDDNVVRGLRVSAFPGVGIDVMDGSRNIVGGPVPGDENVLVANGLAGIRVTATNPAALTHDNVVERNLVGLEHDGTTLNGNCVAATGDCAGIFVHRLKSELDRTVIATNVVADNHAAPGIPAPVLLGGDGIAVIGGVDHLIDGNRIGTDRTGLLPRGNDRHGISLAGTEGVILVDNVISANAWSGLLLSDCTSTVVIGNTIGLSLHGDGLLGNGTPGLDPRGSGVLLFASDGNQIGGPAVADRNVSPAMAWTASTPRGRSGGTGTPTTSYRTTTSAPTPPAPKHGPTAHAASPAPERKGATRSAEPGRARATS